MMSILMAGGLKSTTRNESVLDHDLYVSKGGRNGGLEIFRGRKTARKFGFNAKLDDIWSCQVYGHIRSINDTGVRCIARGEDPQLMP